MLFPCSIPSLCSALPLASKQVFLRLRQRQLSVQAIAGGANVSKAMLKFIGGSVYIYIYIYIYIYVCVCV